MASMIKAYTEKNKFIKLSKKYNIIITPHLGGFTFESLNQTEEIMANYFL